MERSAYRLTPAMLAEARSRARERGTVKHEELAEITQRETLRREQFRSELTKLVNKFNLEQAANIPDHVLADHMIDCMDALNYATYMRERSFGVSLVIGGPTVPPDSVL